jgi:hypothetical protein
MDQSMNSENPTPQNVDLPRTSNDPINTVARFEGLKFNDMILTGTYVVCTLFTSLLWILLFFIPVSSKYPPFEQVMLNYRIASIFPFLIFFLVLLLAVGLYFVNKGTQYNSNVRNGYCFRVTYNVVFLISILLAIGTSACFFCLIFDLNSAHKNYNSVEVQNLIIMKNSVQTNYTSLLINQDRNYTKTIHDFNQSYSMLVYSYVANYTNTLAQFKTNYSTTIANFQRKAAAVNVNEKECMRGCERLRNVTTALLCCYICVS